MLPGARRAVGLARVHGDDQAVSRMPGGSLGVSNVDVAARRPSSVPTFHEVRSALTQTPDAWASMSCRPQSLQAGVPAGRGYRSRERMGWLLAAPGGRNTDVRRRGQG